MILSANKKKKNWGCSGESVGLSLLFIPDWGLSCISGYERASEYVTTAYTRNLRNSKHSATDRAQLHSQINKRSSAVIWNWLPIYKASGPSQ